MVRPAALLALGGVSLYLLLPSLLAVAGSWRSLGHLDWPFAGFALLCEVASLACLWEVDRIVLHTRGWFPVVAAQFTGTAASRVLPDAVAAYGAAAGLQMATTPVTPGGLGFVEAGLVATLTFAGVPSPDALAATLLYRIVAYWLPLPAGGVAYLLFRRRYARTRQVRRRQVRRRRVSLADPVPSAGRKRPGCRARLASAPVEHRS